MSRTWKAGAVSAVSGIENTSPPDELTAIAYCR
jgi:hypothetical protein